MQTEEKRLQEKLQVYKEEEKAAKQVTETGMGYVYQGGKQISVVEN